MCIYVYIYDRPGGQAVRVVWGSEYGMGWGGVGMGGMVRILDEACKALGYHSMGLGRFPQSGSIPGVWVDSMGLGGFPVYGPIPLPIHKSSGITTVHICRVHIGHGLI